MPRTKQKKLDPKVLWVVTDSTRPKDPWARLKENNHAALAVLGWYFGIG